MNNLDYLKSVHDKPVDKFDTIRSSIERLIKALEIIAEELIRSNKGGLI